jgi:transketolase
VEQAAVFGWERYVGEGGVSIGMHSFGSSAPLKMLLKKYGFSAERVAEAAREQLGGARR